MKNLFLLTLILISTFACTTNSDTAVNSKFKTNTKTVAAGTEVKIKGTSQKLYNEGGNIKEGKPIFKFVENLNPNDFKGKVSLISFVPSVVTPVCEQQTHMLAESPQLDPQVQTITISRDTNATQQKFAKEARLTNITYLSDSKDKKFGELSGLLMTEKNLLARGVIVVDQKGIIRHLQIVPEVTELPDMAKAFAIANQLVHKK